MGWEDLVALIAGSLVGYFSVKFVGSYKKWAVVQDLRPFGYRIERTYFREASAIRKANKSRYLSVMSIKEAKEENKRLKNIEVFNSELYKYLKDIDDNG